MPYTYFAGKFAFITLGGVTYPMDTWEFSEQIETVEVTNFTTVNSDSAKPLGVQKQLIPGVYGGSFSTSGPYIGVAPIAGVRGVAVFGYATGLSVTRNVITVEVKLNTQVKDKATLSISGEFVLDISP